ncbi:lipoprotein [Staphylococcus saccharolyticus]|uniref:Lipoprotein n=1 Tax=Staphylococcus saccharolyticus TaxID=33028 RepID=A0A380GXR5_9STAP|nr:lipoprotein [Staphylococcus saccharolyticus]
MVKAKDLEEVKILEDLTCLKDPKATSYGILQTKYEVKPYTQVSILGSGSEKEGDISDAILAYYLFSPTELDSDDNHKYIELLQRHF